MGTAQIDSVLAKKLSTFLVLSPGELKCLADMQSAPLKVKRGKQLTQEGQTGHRAFVHPSWLGIQLQGPSQWPPSGHFVSDTGRLCGAAQRAAANRGSFRLGIDGCRGQSRGGSAHIGKHHRVSRVSGRRSCGQPPATKPWWLSISSISGGAMPLSARPISSWSWLNG